MRVGVHFFGEAGALRLGEAVGVLGDGGVERMVEVVLGVIHEIKLFFSTKGQACPGRLIYQYFAVSGSPSLMPLQSLFAPLLYCCSKLTFTPLSIFYLFQFCELSLLPCDSVVSALAFLSRSML